MKYLTPALESKKYQIVFVDLGNDVEFFAGYDFMGSVIWVDDRHEALAMDPDEAQQILEDLEAADEPSEAVRSNAGYEIVRSLRIDSTHEIVIGLNPDAPSKYVVWDCINGENYHTGFYCLNFRQALRDMADRIIGRNEALPMEA